MISQADLNEAIGRLEQRRDRTRRRLAALSTRFRLAAGDVGAALDEIGQTGADSLELAQTFVTELQREANEKLQDYADRLGDVAQDATSYATRLANLNLDKIAEEAQSGAEAFIGTAVDTIETRIDTLLSETFEACVAELSLARTEMLSDLNDHETTFQGESDAWQATLRTSKEVLEARLEELTKDDFDEAWKEMGEEMKGALLADIELTRDRIVAVRTKIEGSMAKIAQIVEMFGHARRAKDVTVQSAGTALQTISTIFNDLEAILESVK